MNPSKAFPHCGFTTLTPRSSYGITLLLQSTKLAGPAGTEWNSECLNRRQTLYREIKLPSWLGEGRLKDQRSEVIHVLWQRSMEGK